MSRLQQSHGPIVSRMPEFGSMVARLTIILALVTAPHASLTLAAVTGGIPQSHRSYRLPYADGTHVKVFDDFATHSPRGRVDLYATGKTRPHRVVAAAAGRVVAIQDGYREQQPALPAAKCRNNYVWIAHSNGEWTNYSHVAYHSVTRKARLKIGDVVQAGQYIADEDEVGCAMFKHLHFEVAEPDQHEPLDSGGFLTDNENGKRERNPRFCGIPDRFAIKGQSYIAAPCRAH